MTDGPYSDVEADTLGVNTSTWHGMSRDIRVEHECTHYVTRRLFGSMGDKLLDELIANYAGIVAACGRFHAEWFLSFLGLREGGDGMACGRLQNYRGDPRLSDSAFRILGRLACAAARNLETFDRTLPELRSAGDQMAVLYTLCASTVEALAAPDAPDLLSRAFADFAAT
ncbi:MAG: hypothetical protein U5K74_01145 [Gemmatimonadaceae bacterium]|nr:hypothetical protein [Gemmatimonadaceae bacterium]